MEDLDFALDLFDDAEGDDNPARAEDPDRQLIALARAGEARAAISLLMQRYGVDVYRYCRTELRDPALADDVQQTVFIQAYRHLTSFAGRSTVRTWLFAIARHRVLDASKARRRAQAHLEDVAVDPADPSPAADEQLDAAREERALVAALADLGEPARTALLLRYQQGFTFDEMAEICGERPGTLQARVARALPRIRELLEAKPGGR